MKKIINFKIYQGEKYYVAECIDLPIVTQGLSLDETMANIKEALSLHLEDEDLNTLHIMNNPAVSVNFDLGELVYA
ncbi:MAG: type II toxin-antitoxin system HicB family antitoxin [Candidatus Kapabacteria bacterium]|nr:type II toxin-antitoxin system HicB family antitoxin [Ignavibacteriota bacterium]MCW5885019.1 type II toxin-antitoxin system HicB family antitoxin [Candidatus Kapabacteria bacterium]